MESTRRPVVVGVNGRQPIALHLALKAARSRAVPLRVVHSASLPIDGGGQLYGHEVLEKLRQDGLAILDDARQIVEDGTSCDVAVEYVLVTHNVFDALMEEAKRAAMLVLGTDEVPRVVQWVGSAVSTHCALHAPCPVVVVPEHSQPTPRRGGVVVGLDGESFAAGPLRFAFEQAEAVGGRDLRVVHAVEWGTPSADVEELRANIGEILAGWRSEHPDVNMTVNFPIGAATDVCRRASE